MNLDEIKKKMEAEGMKDLAVPTNIKQLKKSKLPIQKVRNSMRSEIITQLIIIVLFFTVPLFLEMNQMAKGLYFILQFITALITLLYIAKMTWFLNKTSNISASSRDTVMGFIHDLKLTLEVYKTAIIAGSLILPLSVAALFSGSGKLHLSLGEIQLGGEDLFFKLFSLDMSAMHLMICIGIYLIMAAFIYYSTVKWADSLYGIHIDKLEETLQEFEV
jgi:hypothetical protein